MFNEMMKFASKSLMFRDHWVLNKVVCNEFWTLAVEFHFGLEVFEEGQTLQMPIAGIMRAQI